MVKRKSLYRKGDEVTIVNHIAGITTEETGYTVLCVDRKGVWLDNGPGNDPSGPFDKITGQWADNGIIPGASMKIKPAPVM